MCGICGIYHLEPARPVEPKQLDLMTQTLHHRGPDDEGCYLQANLGLGHKRLSIIDLSAAGRQPMPNENERYWVIFNGEIYNYLELRQRLIGRGHHFRSHTDTEVVLHLYEDEGPGCLTHLNGMFAFAIWDAAEYTLFAARDHLGIKPFYYVYRHNTFLFASEIKAILRTGLVEPQLNPAGLADYLTFQFCLDDKTLFQHISKLLPGHYLQLRANGQLTIQPYWDIDFTIDTDHTESYFQQKLAMLLEDAVRLQLRADVPLGAHLSGGLDSTTVSCLATSLLATPIHTFSGGFKDAPQYDESAYASLAATSMGAIHHEIFPTAADFVEIMPRLIYYMDEPAAGPGLFPQYFVSQLAGQHVKVVLGGQGGDEIFGGYTRYLIAYLEACLRGGIEGSHEDGKFVVTFESILPNLTQLQGYESLLKYFWQDGLFGPAEQRYFRLIDRSKDTYHLINPDFWAGQAGYSPFEAYRAWFNHPTCRALINKMSRFDLKMFLPALLQVEDRTSMAVSLESRVPLLDYRLVELVASMPPMIKFKGGRSKHIFRQVVQDLVPPEISRRTDKMGFPVPLNEWYRQEPVRSFTREVLLGRRAQNRELFRLEQVEPLLDSERDYGRGLWGLLNLELWMQVFLDGQYQFQP
jgi:asparagine synthase (glutamine-hydrolysing)